MVRVDSADVPAQGYTLRTRSLAGGGVQALAQASDELGAWYALRAAAELVTAAPYGGHLLMPEADLEDHPTLLWRGTIEGFYGPPWSHQDRLDFLHLAGRLRLTTYVYAPKDDVYHRERWRDPYPEDELQLLSELVAVATAERVELVYGLSPGLDIRYAEDAELATLLRKARQLHEIGVRRFALLLDDIPPQTHHVQDVERFGGGPAGLGAAQGHLGTRFHAALAGLAPGNGPGTDNGAGPLIFCPTDYAGTERTPYRDALATSLPDDALVLWTGRDIVVGDVTRADVDRAAASFRRDLLLWDNYPVNDFDRARLFLGPLVGRTTDVAGSKLRGVLANPMIEAAPSAFALASIALWAWNPTRYDAEVAATWARGVVAGPLGPAIGPLVAACSSWPPSAPQSPRLAALADAALGGDQEAHTALRRELEALRSVAEHLTDVGPEHLRLASQLAPWAGSAALTAEAFLAALDLLEVLAQGRGTGDPGYAGPAVRRTRVALQQAEEQYQNVLRGVVGPFVRAALARAEGTQGGGDGPIALVVTGRSPAPGDMSLTETLRARGLVVRDTAGLDPRSVVAAPQLVFVTRSAEVAHAAAAARLQAPVITWAHLVELGLGTRADMLTVQDTVVVTAEAADIDPTLSPGPVVVHRGPGTLTWCEPGSAAVVLARATDGRAVLVRYPPGSRLADGTTTRHGRTALFLGREGMSPWLVTDEGRALLGAVLDRTLVDARSAPEVAGGRPQR